MKIKTKQIHTLNTGIFRANILFCMGFAYDEIIQELKKQRQKGWINALSNDRELISGGTNFALKRTLEDGITYYFIIFTESFRPTDWWYIKIAHESLHICQFLLPDLLNRDREFEAEAYLHTHIMEQILKRIKGK